MCGEVGPKGHGSWHGFVLKGQRSQWGTLAPSWCPFRSFGIYEPLVLEVPNPEPEPDSHGAPGTSLFNNDYYQRKLETEDRQVYEGRYLGVVQVYKARPTSASTEG